MVYTEKINYDDGDLESVELTSSSRRALLAHDERDSSAIVGRRLDFDSCAVCEEAYDAVCEGVLSVCDLEDFGNPFSAEAAASVDIACGTFGSACSRFEASVACRDQCTPEGVYITRIPRFVGILKMKCYKMWFSIVCYPPPPPHRTRVVRWFYCTEVTESHELFTVRGPC